MKNVIGYIRVSTDAQAGEDAYGLEAQKEQIRQYCKEHDLNLMDWKSDEGLSGAKERPGFDEIVYGAVTNPPTEAVVVAKSDRVARDINVYYYYKMLLRKKDIELISVSEDFGQMGVFSTMLEAFTLCAAQMERENIMHRTYGGRKIKANEGGYSGGKVPFGYKIVNGEYAINEEEAEIVRRIYALHASGGSYRGIAKTLSKKGFTGRNGKDLGYTTVRSILKNKKTYQGLYHFRGNKDGAWVQGKHEPILPPDEEV